MEDQQNMNATSELQQIEKEFRREVAITQARPVINRAVSILWLAIDVGLVGLLFVITVGYLVSGQWKDRSSAAGLVANLSSIHFAAQERAAQALFVGESIVLGSQNGYDFVAQVQNPNEDWFAQFDYVFADGTQESDKHTGFLFPGETRHFIALNEPLSSVSSEVEMIISDLTWQRLDAHLVDDVDTWYIRHHDFTFSNIEHSTVQVGDRRVVRSSFTVKNESPYGYWSAPFLLILERNGMPVGVHQVSIAGFEIGEARDVSVNWFDETPASGDLIIEPMINYLDDDVYMSLTPDATLDTRDIERD